MLHVQIGCTNLQRLMFYTSGHLPLNTVDWPWVDDTLYLQPALKHASLMNNTLTKKEKYIRFHTYYSFMFVRNPLERLVSGYRNKLEHPLVYGKEHAFPQSIKVAILSLYRADELNRWREEHMMATDKQQQLSNITVTFPEFVRFYVESESVDLNIHFRPSIDVCHPCLTQFNFYGDFRNISADVKQLIHKFETDPRFFRDESLHSTQEQTRNKLKDYYKRLTYRDKLQLLGRMYDDLLFFYTLYPSERHSHYDLLGIRQQII